MGSHYSEYQLSETLSPFIDCVWFGNEDADESHYIIPDNTIELIFSSSSISRQTYGTNEKIVVKSHIAGLKTKAQNICIESGRRVAVRFKPAGIHPFVKHDISSIIDRSIEPVLVFGKNIQSLEDQILESLYERHDQAAIVQAIETYFMNAFQASTSDNLVSFVINFIKSNNGNASIASIADRIGCSIKTIERKFKQKIGLTPKKYSSLYRFHQSVLDMETPTDKLSDIAYDHGYFDQMHFIKDVKRYAGFTPKNLFALKSGLQEPTLTKR